MKGLFLRTARSTASSKTTCPSMSTSTPRNLLATAPMRPEPGAAEVFVPLPVLAEWWRGRTDDREILLGAMRVDASIEATKAAGVALARVRGVNASHTIDAIVMATAALRDAVVVTQDPQDLGRLAVHVPGVTVFAV